MKKPENNYAFIDGANLYKGVVSLGWKLDYKRFRVWLTEKYAVRRAYLFIGLVPKHADLYTSLQNAGFILVFKETVNNSEGKIKGNCDADLVLRAVCDCYENKCDRMVLVSSDGDYAGLVQFLKEKRRFYSIISPSDKCSILLKRTNVPIIYLSGKRNFFEYIKEKAPDADGTAQGSLS